MNATHGLTQRRVYMPDVSGIPPPQRTLKNNNRLQYSEFETRVEGQIKLKVTCVNYIVRLV